MFVTVYKNGTPVCNLSVGLLSLAGVFVYDFHVLRQDLMPFSCNPGMSEAVVRHKLQEWLESRVLPDSTPELDQIMLDVYELKPTHYGRMYGYQYLGAFMAYLVSDGDEYWVNPQYAQVLTYALVDPHFINAYICEPVTSLAEAKSAGGKFTRCLRSSNVQSSGTDLCRIQSALVRKAG